MHQSRLTLRSYSKSFTHEFSAWQLNDMHCVSWWDFKVLESVRVGQQSVFWRENDQQVELERVQFEMRN